MMIRHLEVIDERALKKVLKEKEAIIHVITNGGVHKYRGTFGVVLYDGKSILVRNRGQIYSVDFHQSAYRSKLYAMLAGLGTFRHTMAELRSSITTSLKIRVHVDNMTVIKTIQHRCQHSRTINQHHDAEVDLELQIMEEIRREETSSNKIEIKHIASHGINMKKKDLTITEKLHCVADGLEYTNIIIFLVNPVTLSVNRQTINANYTKVT
jgi:hypothetical protein